MEIAGIIWLRSVIDKLAQKHHVDPTEVEEVFCNRPRFRRVAQGYVGGEVYSAMGQSNAGRYLSVFFVYKRSREVLVITTRDMSPKERRQYDKT